MEDNKLRNALIKVACRNRTQRAFQEELISIDPEMEKIAWGRLWRGIKSTGRSIGSGIKSGANWVAKNPWEAALTASMFVPGLNVASGLGRGALALGRAGSWAMKARKAGQVAKAAKGAMGVRKANQAKTLATSLSKSHLGRAAGQANPLNRGSMLWGKSTPGSFKSLSKPWQVARVAGTGFGLNEARGIPGQVKSIATRSAVPPPPKKPGLSAGYSFGQSPAPGRKKGLSSGFQF
jgi:hypothetical protein